MNTDRAIPLPFVQERKRLTWREVELGVREQWLNPEDAITLALDRVEQGDDRADVLALASVLRRDAQEVPGFLSELVRRDPGNSESAARLSWMRILLAWIYENRSAFADPLGLVEEIYADFGYPDEIRQLVRYNPPAASDTCGAGSEPTLMRHWAEYLKTVQMG